MSGGDLRKQKRKEIMNFSVSQRPRDWKGEEGKNDNLGGGTKEEDSDCFKRGSCVR